MSTGPASTDPLFGTDGIRAPFGQPPLDEATVTALGWHLGRTLVERAGDPAEPPLVELGGDTRDSTPTLIDWLCRGLTAAGAQAETLGTVPTPAVAHLARIGRAAAGIAVSASHNPHPDNGIKLLTGDGYKWTDRDQAALEERLRGDPEPAALGDAPAGEPRDGRHRVAEYLGYLRSTVGPAGAAPLAGLEVVLDPGHGAASAFAGDLFEALGARATVLHAAPDGRNINRQAGSTRPRIMAREVERRGAHLGVAFDGDADRAIVADGRGRVRDGDAILYLWARDLHQAGELDPPAIVATTMSNLGLEKALERHGVELVRCGVGDRQVVATLRSRGLLLGGEQSGHVVHLGLSHTGDGLLTALQVAARVAHHPERSLVRLLEGLQRFPQVLVNVEVRAQPPLEELPAVAAAVRRVEADLAGEGRLVLRYSGTEPLARVMIEGRDQTAIEELAGQLATAIDKEIGRRGASAAAGRSNH